jgi:hypothetical protein
MAQDEHVHSPFIFADTLIRNSINMAALDLEVIMGVTPRGNCLRPAETSRLLDLYSLLGVPMHHAQLSVRQQRGPGRRPRAAWTPGGGNAFGPESQAEWAEAFTALAVAKPYVQAVHWSHFADADPHQVPHGGLVDAAGALKPALERLRKLRATHLT